MVCYLDTDTGFDRAAAVPAVPHLFGFETHQRSTTDVGAQDAFTQDGMCLGHTIRVPPFTISNFMPRFFLKHPIDYTEVERHMLVQAGAEPAHEGHTLRPLHEKTTRQSCTQSA